MIDDEIVIRPMLKPAVTLDHRIVDGLQASQLVRAVEYLASPWDFEADVPRGTDPVEETGEEPFPASGPPAW